jgi:hypothetical protein
MADGPEITEPLDKWAGKLLDAALQRHTLWCMQHGMGPQIAEVRADLSRMKLRLVALLAFMAGSGLLGGAAGAAVVRYVLGG